MTAHGSSFDDPVRALFGSFLERRESTGESLTALCKAHPQHAERFRRWWDALEALGQIDGQGDALASFDPSGETGRIGPYRVVEELGRGSQGTVYLADDTRLGRRVALKVLSELRGMSREVVARFTREAEMASRLDDPGIATVYESDTYRGWTYIAMRYVEGRTLAEYVAEAIEDPSAAQPWTDLVRLFEKVAASLHTAHGHNLVHRDIKPANIIVREDGAPFVLDFGLAREIERSDLTISGDLLGTPAYMSPEQLTAQRIGVDRRTDVYSLGATLFECVTLQRPFEAPTREELYQKILVTEAPDARDLNRDIPKDLAIVLATTLEKDRNRRYQTAADFAEDLRRVRKHEPILAKPASLATRVQRFVQRRPAVARSLLAITVVLAVALAFSYYAFREASGHLDNFNQLADLVKLDEIVRRESGLYPATPARIGELESWLHDEAEPLFARLELHRGRLAELRKKALPLSVAEAAADRANHRGAARLALLESQLASLEKLGDSAFADPEPERMRLTAEIERLQKAVAQRVTYRFESETEGLLHNSLTRLVRRLEEFGGERGPLARVRRHLAWARRVRGVTLRTPKAAWDEARRTVAASSKYGGLELKPQEELVPIGTDGRSGLLELAHPASGDVPERDGEGRLKIGPETSLVFVLIPAGRFYLGAQAEDPSGRNYDKEILENAGPPHEVELDAFLLSKYELTQGQWNRLAGSAREGGADRLDHPVGNLSWQECHRLLSEHGLLLPTEAQWEYAARATTSTVWWHGDDEDEKLEFSNVRGVVPKKPTRRDPVARRGGVLPVGSMRPNLWGLFDVAGNVSEWCRETFGAYRKHPALAPGDGERAVPPGLPRVVRGGYYLGARRHSRIARRGHSPEAAYRPTLGVRPSRRLVE